MKPIVGYLLAFDRGPDRRRGRAVDLDRILK